MKKIKIFPAPHMEIRVSVSDEMIKDYKNCVEITKHTGELKNCANCSWNDVRIANIRACYFGEMHVLQEETHEKEN